MKFNLDKIVRKNIQELVPYSSARDEYSGDMAVFMDANENPFNHPYNRYPDPHQKKLKKQVSKIFGLPSDNIFLGNGSDEGIDLLFRAFCEPGIDNVIGMDPTYGMYEVCANIQNVSYRKVPLNPDYSLDAEKILKVINRHTRLIFLCSPNNPTSNQLEKKQIMKIIKNFSGLVVLDEAYIDFAPEKGLLDDLVVLPNLVILRTLSKAWGLASIRLGMVFASKDIVEILTKIKYPYNLNKLSQDFALKALTRHQERQKWIEEIMEEREELAEDLMKFSFVRNVFPSDANFLLVKTTQPKKIYTFLADKDIIVRDRSSMPLCEGCLRITVGTKEENKILLRRLSKFKDE